MRTTEEPSITALEETLGDKRLVLFVVAYLKNGLNATKAYLELHPKVKYETAMTLGSRMLRKVQVGDLLALHGMGPDEYLQKLKEGLDATKPISAVVVGKDANEKTMDFVDVPDFKTRREYHKALGRLLGFERGEFEEARPVVNVQNIIGAWVKGGGEDGG